VDYKAIDWSHHDTFRDNVTPERIVAEAKKAAEALLKKSIDQAVGLERTDNDESFSITDYQFLTPNDVVVDFAIMHYGMKDKNPLDFIEFYSKRHPNGSYTCFPIY
jgi:deoxynucleoside triphosphate triphosphohydrolase SAMHD1